MRRPVSGSTARAVAGLVLALLLPASTAAAGELAAEVTGGYLGLTASRSAEAVFDSSGGFTWGGAARYTITRGIFVSAGVRTFSKEGERVFVDRPNGEVARLGFPLSVRVTPVLFTAGYRFRDGRMVVPYAGLGGSLTSFSEESSVAGRAYDVSRTKAGFHVVGGAEVGRGRFRFGAEVGWSTVPNAVGFGGVSAVYDEDDLGGWSVVGKVVVSLWGGKKAPEAVEDDALGVGEAVEDDVSEPDDDES
jgi:hypothetical protein